MPKHLVVYTMMLSGLAGCQSVNGPTPEFQQEIAGYLDTQPVPYRGLYESLYIEGERNSVLNFNRIGWLNLVYGDFDEAAWAFDQSLSRIETIYADDPKAEAAKSKFSEESVKDFKGEPYERAMAYYYRGILYLIEGDYENARAAFKMGEFQDTLSSKEQFQSDFALLNYLQGWASACNGDKQMADESFEFASQYSDALFRPDASHKLLMLLDSGGSPIKLATGEYGEFLQFTQGKLDGNIEPVFYLQYVQSVKSKRSVETPSAGRAKAVSQEIAATDDSVRFQDEILYFTDERVLEDSPAIVETEEAAQSDDVTVTVASGAISVAAVSAAVSVVDAPDYVPARQETDAVFNESASKTTVVASLNAFPAVDVFNQATTRGGRPIQGILDGKAQFKSTTETIGAVATTAGALTTVAGLAGGNDVATAVGLGLQVAGLVATAVSKATTPQADTRYWDTLPNTVYLATVSKPEGPFLLKIGNKSSDSVVPGVYGNVLGGDGKCSVFWATTTNPSSLPNSSPYARLSWAAMADQDDDIQKQDDAFRKSLSGHNQAGF
ncbi:MAG: hypothetical protein ACU84J_03905 [Gammaproteobacteria bacterium]